MQLDNDQPDLIFNVTVEEPGDHVFVIGYTSPLNERQEVPVLIEPQGENVTEAKAVFYDCQYRYDFNIQPWRDADSEMFWLVWHQFPLFYSSLCRQVVIDMDGGQQIVNVPSGNVTVTIAAEEGTIASIVRIKLFTSSKTGFQTIILSIIDCSRAMWLLFPRLRGRMRF